MNNNIGKEITFLDYLLPILKRKKMVFGLTLSAGVITLLVSFFLPPIYRAETKILPPQMRQFDFFSQMSAQYGYSSDLLRTAVGMNAPNYIYIGMLQSRTVYDRIIERFGLMEAYDVNYKVEARKKLGKLLCVDSGKYGIIKLSVDDRAPERAANMANAFIEELKTLTETLAVTEASRRRLFFDEELKHAKEKLIQAEESLKGFQEKTGAIKIEQQAEVVIKSFAQLRAQIAAKEVELKVMKTYATAQNPDLQRTEVELKGMKEQLAMLEAKGGKNPDTLVPTGRIPTLETGYIRKLRDLKYYEALCELMAKQYEIARLDEARESVIIQVLDKAIPPEKKIKPNRALIVFVALCGGFILSVVAVFYTEYLEVSKSHK